MKDSAVEGLALVRLRSLRTNAVQAGQLPEMLAVEDRHTGGNNRVQGDRSMVGLVKSADRN